MSAQLRRGSQCEFGLGRPVLSVGYVAQKDPHERTDIA
ncbi:hypothetical protein PARU111607_15635 [Palleronia rufa]